MNLRIEDIKTELQRAFLRSPSAPLQQPDKHGKPASVMIPLVVYEEKISVLFTKRTNNVRDHQGQISFPGGAIETEDLSPLSAAYRETFEEIGLPRNHITLLGELNPRNTITGYYVYPFIGFINSLQNLIINPFEVEKIIIIPICWLMMDSNSRTEMYERPGVKKHPVIFYEAYNNEIIWGITASIIHDFLSVIKNSEGKIPSLLGCEEK